MSNVTPFVLGENNKPIPISNGDTLTYPDGSPIITSGEPKATHRARVLAVSNIADLTTPPAAIDGVTLSDGDAILLIGQTTATQNGLYTLTAGELVRHSAMDENTEINATIHVQIIEGSIHAGELYALAALGGLTIGVSNIDFTLVVTKRQRHVYSQELYAIADNEANYVNFAVAQKAGYIIGIEVLAAEARTAGSCTFTPRNITQAENATIAAELNGTDTETDYATAIFGNSQNAFSAGDILGINIAVNSGFTPLPNRFTVNLTIEFEA